MRSTADPTVDKTTPKLRAIDAGVPSSAATRSHAHLFRYNLICRRAYDDICRS